MPNHRASTSGYLAPLTWTCWTIFIATAFLLMSITNLLIRITNFVGHRYAAMLITLTMFAFNTFYSQDLRSSTIEPLFEKLPNKLHEIDTRTQNVASLGLIPFFDFAKTWNLLVLKTFDIDESDMTDYLFQNLGWSPRSIALHRMTKSPNYFALLEKGAFYSGILPYVDPALWQWRLSNEVNHYIMKCFVYRKYEVWREAFNLLTLHITVSLL